MTSANSIMTSLAAFVPHIAVCLVGIIIAAIRWQRHPTISLLAGGALLISLLAAISRPFVTAFIVNAMQGNAADSMRAAFSSINMVYQAVSVLTYSLLLCAVFLGRNEPPPFADFSRPPTS